MSPGAAPVAPPLLIPGRLNLLLSTSLLSFVPVLGACSPSTFSSPKFILSTLVNSQHPSPIRLPSSYPHAGAGRRVALKHQRPGIDFCYLIFHPYPQARCCEVLIPNCPELIYLPSLVWKTGS